MRDAIQWPPTAEDLKLFRRLGITHEEAGFLFRMQEEVRAFRRNEYTREQLQQHASACLRALANTSFETQNAIVLEYQAVSAAAYCMLIRRGLAERRRQELEELERMGSGTCDPEAHRADTEAARAASNRKEGNDGEST